MNEETLNKDIGLVTAYAYAVEGGYEGTEEEFEELLGGIEDAKDTAVEAASAAAVSANNSSEYAESASSSAATASTKATEASASASAASASASTAATKAGEASASATTASNKASAASTSANNASASATAAAASATSASNKASEAATSASTADARATTAGTHATNAAASALASASSATDAETAQLAAQTAQTGAETAQGLAEDAQEAAETAQAAAETAASTFSTDKTLSVSDKAADAKVVGDTLEEKANIDGNYKDMTVGSSEQLLSDKYTEDTEPYLFRPSASGKSDREDDTIVGGTVAWNQLVRIIESKTENGITGTNNGDGSYTVDGTATATFDAYRNVAITQNHVYAILGIAANASSDTAYVYFMGAQSTDTLYKYFGASTVTSVDVIVKGGATVENMTFKPQLFDLTAMFGSTIADYIYNLEQTTAGAGVALFKKLFPKDYYAYDAGSLKSVEGLSSHKMVGFNQWDEEIKLGYYSSSTGAYVSNNSYLCCKNPIKVLPDTIYYFAIRTEDPFQILFYDYADNLIGTTGSGAGRLFTTPKNCHYMRFWINSTYGTTYNHDICINISDPSHNGEYEPYVAHEYPLDDSLTLRGIPKLVDGKIQYDGDTYKSDGTVTRKYGIVDLGTVNWGRWTNNIFGSEGIKTLVKCPESASNAANMLCPAFLTKPYFNVITEQAVRGISLSTDGTIGIYSEVDYPTSADFKTAMSGVYLVYELAEPTTEQAEPYTNPQIVDPYGTEEYVSTGIVPVGHITKYPDNLRAKIEGLPWDMGMIAPIETGTTASQAYSTGQYFLKDDKFCKALASIASGATLTLNTNYAVTTLAAELYAALNA